MIDVAGRSVIVGHDQGRSERDPVLFRDRDRLQALDLIRRIGNVRVGRVGPRMETCSGVIRIVDGSLGRSDRGDTVLKVVSVLGHSLSGANGVCDQGLPPQRVVSIGNRFTGRR